MPRYSLRTLMVAVTVVAGYSWIISMVPLGKRLIMTWLCLCVTALLGFAVGTLKAETRYERFHGCLAMAWIGFVALGLIYALTS